MTINEATTLLMNHRNGIEVISYQDRKAAIAALSHLVTEWIQIVSGEWQLVVIGYVD